METELAVKKDKTNHVKLKAKDFKGNVDPDWCPGCGDFGVLNSLQKTCSDLGLQPHEILTVSGIGCSSNFPDFLIHTVCIPSMAVRSLLQPAPKWPTTNSP